MERLVLALTFRDIICISCVSAAMIGYPGKKQLTNGLFGLTVPEGWSPSWWGGRNGRRSLRLSVCQEAEKSNRKWGQAISPQCPSSVMYFLQQGWATSQTVPPTREQVVKCLSLGGHFSFQSPHHTCKHMHKHTQTHTHTRVHTRKYKMRKRERNLGI